MEETAGIVAIVGRPNVGKSTLFNRLIGRRKAIIDDQSGVTRDRIYGHSHWNGKMFQVVDTGGFVPHSDDVYEQAVREQVNIAIDEAHAILFIVDVTTGITDLDEEMAGKLRKSPTPVLLVVNKVDNHQRQMEAHEFWGLGFEQAFFIAANSGSGTGDLLDALTEELKEIEEFDPDLPKLAIIGRPNVGKSSFVNALIGSSRNLVTPEAGTTRDSVHTHYTKYGKDFTLIDTAGLRKKAKVKENIEFYSVMRAIRSIEEAEVCFLMVDATRGVESQDMAIFSLAKNRNKGIVIAVNKWDLIRKETDTARMYEEMIHERIAPFSDVPIVFISVLEKQRISRVLDLGIEVYERRSQRISTSKLNKILQPILEQKPPPTHKGRTPNIKYVTQIKTYFPAFAFFCNHPDHVKPSYQLFLENQLRNHFNFTGVPIKLYFRQK